MRILGNPYSFAGPRPFREARLRSYIVNQHRTGRPLAAILRDPYVRRCGRDSLCRTVLQDRRTIELLERDVRETFAACSPGSFPRRKRTGAPGEGARSSGDD